MRPYEKKNSDIVTIKPQGKLERLIAYLEEVKASRFTGYIKINFSQGNIARIEKFEEILKN